MNDTSKYTEILTECKDLVERKQIGFLLGRQRAALDPSLEIEEDLNQIISNTKLSEFFKQLARDLDVLEPKTAEQTLKTHLEERKQNDVADSAKENLATTYVNGLVNAAFCKDLLLTVEGGDSWVHKNKDHGMMAAAASLGMLMLWDIDQGLTDIDKYCNVNNEYIVAGAYIGIGIVNSGIKNECDPVYAILHEALENSAARQITKIGALIGLSLTYAGSKRQDLLDDFSPSSSTQATLSNCRLLPPSQSALSMLALATKMQPKASFRLSWRRSPRTSSTPSLSSSLSD